MDERILLVNLPTSVRGFTYHDDDGNPYIVLNARLSREANIKTLDHEKQHIANEDMYNLDYHEYIRKE